MTAVPDHQITLSQSQAAAVLGYSVSTFRRMYRAGDLPGPIDPNQTPKRLRWSRPRIEAYRDHGPIAADRDWTPPNGIDRPALHVVEEVAS